MHTDLDALVTALYVRVDEFLPRWRGRGRPPRISDAELITVAVAQMFLGYTNDRAFLEVAGWRLGHLFPYLPKQPGYNKRVRGLAPAIARVIAPRSGLPIVFQRVAAFGLDSRAVRPVA